MLSKKKIQKEKKKMGYDLRQPVIKHGQSMSRETDNDVAVMLRRDVYDVHS